MLFYPATPLHMITEDMVFDSSNSSRCRSPLAWLVFFLFIRFSFDCEKGTTRGMLQT